MLKMENSRKKLGLVLFVIILFSNICLSHLVNRTQSIDPFFTLVFKTNGGGVRPDYGNFLKQHCARIGIEIDVVVLSWSDFFSDVILFKDFDICYFSFEDENAIDPDFSQVYSENGLYNLFGYSENMDWSNDYLMGINEWYLKNGVLFSDSNSQERVQHYRDWQQYLMDEILPIAPTYSPMEHIVYWSNLIGYNFSNGLKESWGKMSWSGTHEGQINDDEIVICNNPWINLNPLFSMDSASSEIINLVFDPLIMIDSNHVVWPHLAQNYTFLNSTHLRISCREGIKWQAHPDSLLTNEYFDADDVYFSLFCWKYLSCNKNEYTWIKDMLKINQTCIDLFIDGDPSTIQNEPYTPVLSKLSTTLILPEHYLNLTQSSDEVTPDVNYFSWFRFCTEPIGTSLFELNNHTENLETSLSIFQNCWWMNTSIVSDSQLDWINRFGDFSDPINQLRIRIIPDLQNQILEFEIGGTIDIVDITWDPLKRNQYLEDPNYDIQSDTSYRLDFYGYNLQRPIIGNREPAVYNPELTKGLCFRKAISYACDRQEINQVIHRGEYSICDHPIYPKLGVWNNPNIIRYNHDIDKAREYITRSGVDQHSHPLSDPPFIVAGLIIGLVVFLAVRNQKKTKEKDKEPIIMKTQVEEEKREINGENK